MLEIFLGVNFSSWIWLENDEPSSQINQWIVLSEQVVSEYQQTREIERDIYTLRIIWWPDVKVTDRETVSEMKLFNDLSNNFISTGYIGVVRMLYFYANIVLTK